MYYNTIDKNGNYWTFRWVDNNIVKMVSNIHTGASNNNVNVLKNRRKPGINEFNRKRVQLIWGDEHNK